MNQRTIFLIIGALIVLAIAGILLTRESNDPVSQENGESMTGEQEFVFEREKKSSHYESNTPAHGSVLPDAPLNVVIDFNFDLAFPSTISITKDGTEYGVGETLIDDNELSMRQNFSYEAPDGLYEVAYNACWPDGSCHDGHFAFAIDRTRAESYEDLRGEDQVTIHMSALSFAPKNVIVSPGASVTWVNDDPVEHFVNTDGHPAHTYYLAQNSRGLAQGETFSLVFETPGAYPYHCSAHANTMTGNIIVR
jgi:plastocyanin/methionine-rich copper-binding protein CopC